MRDLFIIADSSEVRFYFTIENLKRPILRVMLVPPPAKKSVRQPPTIPARHGYGRNGGRNMGRIVWLGFFYVP